jgi:hypothetical protein
LEVEVPVKDNDCPVIAAGKAAVLVENVPTPAAKALRAAVAVVWLVPPLAIGTTGRSVVAIVQKAGGALEA